MTRFYEITTFEHVNKLQLQWRVETPSQAEEGGLQERDNLTAERTEEEDEASKRVLEFVYVDLFSVK